MRAVLDSNVILSGVLFRGPESRVLDLGRKETYQPVLSEFIIA